jgi:ribosomal protein L6P/L9E
LNKLRGETKHNATLWSFINTLAASGQTTTLATLAGASRSQLNNQVTKAVSGYNSSLTLGGDAAVNAKYGMTTVSQQHLVNTMVSNQNKWLSVVGQLVHAMNHSKTELHVDGHKIAAYVTNSAEMSRVFAEIEHLLAKGAA